MSPTPAKISFYFPKISGRTNGKHATTDAIMRAMRRDGNIKYTGYLNERAFKRDLISYMGAESGRRTVEITGPQKRSIQKIIASTIAKCHRALPHPNLPIFIFVYPWFPKAEKQRQFSGATAFVSYYTLHLFIDPESFTRSSIEETIAHEWNHLVYYRYHEEPKRTLRSHMIMEGLAEIFREEVIGGKHAPWSLALSARDLKKYIGALNALLENTSPKLYRDVFFGSKKYKRWTGYSIGYRLAAAYRHKNRKKTWTAIVKSDPKNIFSETAGQ